MQLIPCDEIVSAKVDAFDIDVLGIGVVIDLVFEYPVMYKHSMVESHPQRSLMFKDVTCEDGESFRVILSAEDEWVAFGNDAAGCKVVRGQLFLQTHTKMTNTTFRFVLIPEKHPIRSPVILWTREKPPVQFPMASTTPETEPSKYADGALALLEWEKGA